MNSIEWTRVLSAAVEAEPSCERVQDFEDAGIISSAEGLVVHGRGGDEFQIMVVQTRYAPRHHTCRQVRRAS